MNPNTPMPPRRALRQVAAFYLTLQGTGTLLWWSMLSVLPSSRPWFVATGAPATTLWAFLAADLLLLAGASLAAAWGLAADRRWAWPVLCIQAGASMYAGLYCLQLWLLDASTWVGALLMLPVLVVPPVLVWLLRPVDYRS
jgi:hypothetical protein